MKKPTIVLCVLTLTLAACAPREEARAPEPEPKPDLAELLERWPADPSLVLPGEEHFRSLRQLTFGGENAEAYWSPDGRSLIYQKTPREEMGEGCDQQYVLDLETGEHRLVSTGRGATTCGYFFPHRPGLLYSSTHLVSPDCPEPPDRSKGYVWKLQDGFDIFTAALDGSGLKQITDTPGYDAEGTVREQDGRIVFTSLRSGDIEIWSMDPDGGDLKQLTHELGYEGGPFYSPDGKRIVYRAHVPKTEKELQDYRTLLEDYLIRPMRLEIYVMDAEGGNPVQLTDDGAANFAPCWFRDGRRILYASNVADPKRRNFDLWMVRDDGTGREQVTTNPTFDGFPLFSPDGRFLVFCSNRNNEQPHETNVFIAEWVD